MFKIYWLFRAIIFAALKSIKFANEPIENGTLYFIKFNKLSFLMTMTISSAWIINFLMAEI